MVYEHSTFVTYCNLMIMNWTRRCNWNQTKYVHINLQQLLNPCGSPFSFRVLPSNPSFLNEKLVMLSYEFNNINKKLVEILLLQYIDYYKYRWTISIILMIMIDHPSSCSVFHPSSFTAFIFFVSEVWLWVWLHGMRLNTDHHEYVHLIFCRTSSEQKTICSFNAISILWSYTKGINEK